jgi:predicted TIM-barrel fold metal-dependent hydrolase
VDPILAADPILFVSADSHMAMPPEAVAEYLESGYQELYGEYLEDHAVALETMAFTRFTPEALELLDPEDLIRSGGDIPWDLDRRLAEMDREGVAAELIFPNDVSSLLPFFDFKSRPYPPDVRLAGIRAYHRFVADFMAESDGRLFGIANPGPCHDMDQTVKDLRWVADNGFRSVSLPGIIGDPSLPPLNSPFYEAFWAACADLNLVLSVHAAHGQKQGELLEFIRRFREKVGMDASPQEMQTALKAGGEAESPFAPNLVPVQVLWELMIGGVFDRYPKLTLALTEVRADWVPATFRYLDERFDESKTPGLARRPSEYWGEHCMAGASSIKRSEVRLRHQIGVEKLMFGRDYPHREGTWPNTWDWLRDAFAGVSEKEARLLLGENAVSCYSLDRQRLLKIANRIGPRPSDIFHEAHVNQALLDNFDLRAGYGRSHEDVDLKSLARTVSI